MASNLFSSLHHYDVCHIICSGWCIQPPYTLLLCWFTHCTQVNILKCCRNRGSEPLEWIPQPSKAHFFGQGWNKCHDQNVYKWVKSLRVYQVVLLCECFDCQAIFSEAIFLFFGIIFIFHAFVFWGSIPYGKIIPLYLNRVVRTDTYAYNYNYKSRYFGKFRGMQSRPTSACVKSCFFAKWQLGKKRGDDLKFLLWLVEIIGEVRCSPHYDPLVWSESRGLLGMIYRVISQFS